VRTAKPGSCFYQQSVNHLGHKPAGECLNDESDLDVFSYVPRLPAWSFQRRICGGVLPPPHSPDKSGATVSPTDKSCIVRRPSTSHSENTSRPIINFKWHGRKPVDIYFLYFRCGIFEGLKICHCLWTERCIFVFFKKLSQVFYSVNVSPGF
jgi:hypothetical protein